MVGLICAGRWDAARSLLKALASRPTAVLSELGFTSEKLAADNQPLAGSVSGDVHARAELSPAGALRVTREPGLHQQAA